MGGTLTGQLTCGNQAYSLRINNNIVQVGDLAETHTYNFYTVVRPSLESGGRGIYVSANTYNDTRAGLLAGSSYGELVLRRDGIAAYVYPLALSGTRYITLPNSSGTLAIASSDIRLKENIEDSNINALDVVDKIKFRKFDWKENSKHQNLGVIADEIEELEPQFIQDGTGGYIEDILDDDGNPQMNIKCLDLVTLTSYYGKAIQELHKKVKELQDKLDSLGVTND